MCEEHSLWLGLRTSHYRSPLFFHARPENGVYPSKLNLRTLLSFYRNLDDNDVPCKWMVGVAGRTANPSTALMCKLSA